MNIHISNSMLPESCNCATDFAFHYTWIPRYSEDTSTSIQSLANFLVSVWVFFWSTVNTSNTGIAQINISLDAPMNVQLTIAIQVLHVENVADTFISKILHLLMVNLIEHEVNRYHYSIYIMRKKIENIIQHIRLEWWIIWWWFHWAFWSWSDVYT